MTDTMRSDTPAGFVIPKAEAIIALLAVALLTSGAVALTVSDEAVLEASQTDQLITTQSLEEQKQRYLATDRVESSIDLAVRVTLTEPIAWTLYRDMADVDPLFLRSEQAFGTLHEDAGVTASTQGPLRGVPATKIAEVMSRASGQPVTEDMVSEHLRMLWIDISLDDWEVHENAIRAVHSIADVQITESAAFRLRTGGA